MVNMIVFPAYRVARVVLCATFCLLLSLRGEAESPNILLLSIDTLRADRLGCYAYPLPTSPHIDKLAEGGLLFEDAICEVPLTAPSMGSMLTSRYPRMNGTTRNGLRLPPDTRTVAQYLQDAGYHTFCVQSNWTLKGKLSGIDRGFDIYNDSFEEKRWGIIKGERSGPRVTELAIQYLQERDESKPFFGWVHYTDPHAPYVKHDGFNPAGRSLRMKKRERVRAKYDSEVAFTDDQVGQLLKHVPENTVVVFVADHGESLYEHNYLGHGRRIYQNNLHIPLIIHGPGIEAGRISAPARGIDMGPTLLGLAGLNTPDGMLGLDLLGEDLPNERPRVVETYGGAVPKLPGAKAIMANKGPQLQGILLEGWKLIIQGDSEPELYRLENDPGELKNLAAEEPAQVALLRDMITQWDALTQEGESGGGSLNEEDLEALESLGYIE